MIFSRSYKPLTIVPLTVKVFPMSYRFCFEKSIPSLGSLHHSFGTSMLVKNVRSIFVKGFQIFFPKHSFEILIKTFHYDNVYNHGKSQYEVSVFES